MKWIDVKKELPDNDFQHWQPLPSAPGVVEPTEKEGVSP